MGPLVSRHTGRMNLLQGTLDLLVLQTLDSMGPMHGWGIARRLERVVDERIRVSYGTMYPALVRLEQGGWIRSEWGLCSSRATVPGCPADEAVTTGQAERGIETAASFWRLQGCSFGAAGHPRTVPAL